MGENINVWGVMDELLEAINGTETNRIKDIVDNLESEWVSIGFSPDSRSIGVARRAMERELQKRGGMANAAVEPVKTASFGNIRCDFYRRGEELWMTREQIGSALGYSEPRIAIDKIHRRHKGRIDNFSGVTKLVTPGGVQETYIYNARGIYEICRWSQQPKADEFFDWVYDILEGIRKGELALQSRSSVPAYTVQPDSKQMEVHAKLLDTRTRQAKLVYQMAKEFKGTIGAEEVKYLISEAMKLNKKEG